MPGTPEYDPYRKKVHFIDPDRPHAHAVCGRGHENNETVWIQDVDCPDCILYVKQYISYFLESVEEALAVLRELEDT
jgi:hypothetical protein